MNSRLRLLFCAALLCLACGARAADNAANAPVMRIYDIGALTSSIPDYPGPSPEIIGAAPPAAAAANAPAADLHPAVAGPITCGTVADMIRTRVRPDTWDVAMGTSIEEMAGRLVVMQRLEMHAMIQDLLKAFESQSAVQVVVRGLLVPSATIPDGAYFTTDALNKALGGNAMNDAVAAPILICHNKQRAHVTSGTESKYVREVDINGDTYDPVVPTLFSGVLFDVRPVVSVDRKAVDVELRTSFNANVKMNTRVVGAPAAAGLRAVSPLAQSNSVTTTTKREAGKPEETTTNSTSSANQMLNSQYLVGIEMDFPTVDTGVVRTTVSVPAGQWVLAGTMANPDEKSPKKTLLLFITAEVVK